MDKKRSLRLGIDLNKAELAWISQLVAIRKSKNLNQDEVAQRMGVDQSTVSRLENLNNGNRSANLALLSKYARAIGAYTGHLVVDAENKEEYLLLKQEIEKHTHSLIHSGETPEYSATIYKVTDVLLHNQIDIWSTTSHDKPRSGAGKKFKVHARKKERDGHRGFAER